jgi:hypothetical protein
MNSIYKFMNTHNRALLFLLASIFFIGSCTNQKSNLLVESKTNLVGLASTIFLNPDGKQVPIEDYFIQPGSIDSIKFDTEKAMISPDGKFFEFSPEVSKPLGLLNVYIGDTTYAIYVCKSDKQKTVFSLNDPDKKYSSVKIKGEMNQWNPLLGEMVYDNGNWQKTFWLAPGQYQYLLLLDGHQTLDPYNKDSIDNNVGGFNSLRVVKMLSENIPEISTASYADNSINISTQNTASLYVLWQNQKIK